MIHQANGKMDEAILKRLFKLYDIKEIPADIMPMTISWCGNSSVATLPTLFDLIQKGKLENHRLPLRLSWRRNEYKFYDLSDAISFLYRVHTSSVMKSSSLRYIDFFLPICCSTNAAALTERAYHWHNHRAAQGLPAVIALSL